MIVLKKKSYILMLIVLMTAVVLAAWKNVSQEIPETESDVLSVDTAERDVVHTVDTGNRETEQKSLVGVWIPYMSLQSDGTENGFKENFTAKIKAAAEIGANAVFVHVRPFADSIYPSNYEPWSHVLTGVQGKDPGYDPLAFMIEQTHRAGLAFHAWINPLRISTGATPAALCENSFYMRNREENLHYFMLYEEGVYYNPASAEVRRRIADSAAEIAEKYEVDGIHFDDYFYPASVEELDNSSYKAYTDSTDTPLPLEKWRTANINALISLVYQKIKRIDKEIVFGISPQGNLENNKEICADVYTWCAQKGYIDYICPQLYYSFENHTLSFDDALRAWTEMPRADGVALYVGLAVYKAGTDADGGTWLNDRGILARQIECAVQSGAEGIVLYAVDHIESEAARAEMKEAKEMIDKLFI